MTDLVEHGTLPRCPRSERGLRRRHRQFVVTVVGLSLLVGAAACSSNNDSGGGEGMTEATSGSVVATSARLLDPDAFASYLEENPEVPVVNVHIPYEGHIEGTDAFVPFEEIGTWADLPEDRSAPIVLYCRSGRMSASATETLTEMGYTDIVDLDGGMNAWTDAGLELLTDPPPGAEAPD